MKKCLMIFSILSCFFLFSCENNMEKEATTSINTTTKIEDDFLYYTVTFKNYDDSILKTIKVKEGDNAIYDLDTPSFDYSVFSLKAFSLYLRFLNL